MDRGDFKLKIGQEVENSAPAPVNPTDIANKEHTEGSTGTGTVLSLNKTAGNRYNIGSPSNASEFTFDPNTIVKGGIATSFIQYTQAELDALTDGYPTVTGATRLINNPTLEADTLYELVAESLDGVNVRYYFLLC